MQREVETAHAATSSPALVIGEGRRPRRLDRSQPVCTGSV